MAYCQDQKLYDAVDIKKRCQGLLEEVEEIQKDKLVDVNMLNQHEVIRKQERFTSLI